MHGGLSEKEKKNQHTCRCARVCRKLSSRSPMRRGAERKVLLFKPLNFSQLFSPSTWSFRHSIQLRLFALTLCFLAFFDQLGAKHQVLCVCVEMILGRVPLWGVRATQTLDPRTGMVCLSHIRYALPCRMDQAMQRATALFIPTLNHKNLPMCAGPCPRQP